MSACKVCAHPRRADIDRALAVGSASNRSLADSLGLSEAALRRHKENHLPATLAKAQAAQEVARADDLLDQMKQLQNVTMSILARAYKAEDLRTALQAVSQARGNLELIGRIVGELEAEKTTVNVLITSPDWLRLRSAVLSALDPYPDARLAVVEALRHAD